MRHSKLAILLALGLVTAAAASAQEKKMEAPKPAPEVQKLAYFVGNWTTEGEMKPGPWGAGGKITGSEHCVWMSGGFFVVCHSDGAGAMGNVYGLGVMGYDAAAKGYTWNGFNSMGENEHATGLYDGKSWVYTNEQMMGGKMIKGRYTVTETSATGYDFKLETSEDGKTWASMMEGKAAKGAQGAPPAK
ncbi:MAG TPA: DUF1579 family protein, partial [Thermoanaerobaculia bacterium]|nr:DUF1579 family protein [Thermoanaerobaculia bacterium]